jgi:hypothetical protein
MKKYRIVFIKCVKAQLSASIVTLTYSSRKNHIPIQFCPVINDIPPFPINFASIQSMGLQKYNLRPPAFSLITDSVDLANLEQPPGQYTNHALDTSQDISTDYYLLAYESLLSS